MHRGPNWSALRLPVQFWMGCGSRQRSSPTGGCPNGMPLKVRTPSFAAALSAQEVQSFTFSRGDSFAQRVSKPGGHLEEGWNTQGGAGVGLSRWLGVTLQAAGVSPATLKNLGFLGGDVPVSFAAFDPFFQPFSPVVVGKNRMNL